MEFSLKNLLIFSNCELRKKSQTYTCTHTCTRAMSVQNDFQNVCVMCVLAAFFGCLTCDCNIARFWAKTTRLWSFFGGKTPQNSSFSNCYLFLSELNISRIFTTKVTNIDNKSAKLALKSSFFYKCA